MRLRLVIRRFGLPDSHILWSSTGLNSTLRSNNAKTTIAEFLHEVDGVIPLEGEEWGIEDYVVEVGGYECVHFCAVESVLKEDDEVVIRPLAINDRRFRRVSGRVQIAADGRRLYDGVAFGRPFLRKPQRPPVRIPSIKRARITYDNGSGAGSDTPNQLVLREEDRSDQDDFDHHEELSAEEIANLAAEVMAAEDADSSAVRSNSRKRTRTGLGIQAVKASGLHAPRSSSFNSRQWRPKQYNTSGETIEESPKSVHFEDGPVNTPATILAMDESDDSDDQDFEEGDADATDSDSEKDKSEANKENIAPGKLIRARVSHETSQGTEAATTDSDETTSASESSSSSDDDSSGTDSTSFTSSNESSDSEGSVSQSVSSSVAKKKIGHAGNDTKTSDQPLPEKHSVEQSNKTTFNQSVPGQGKSVTKKRNARRKLKRQFDRASLAAKRAHLQSKVNAILPVQSQEAEVVVSCDPVMNDDIRAEHIQTITPPEEHTTHTGDGVNLLPDISQDVASKSSSPPQAFSIKMNQNDTHLHIEIVGSSIQQQQTQPAHEESTTPLPHITPTKPDDSSRRTRLDLGGAKRMLFGSLGLREPKSKDEANQLRDELKAKAQLLPGNAIGTSKPLQDPSTSVSKAIVDEDSESWMDKIDLQAVECCYEGVIYSNPPFPFVQRWDPQQYYRANKGRGGRNKRKKRNAKQYYQDGYQYYGNYDGQHDHPDQDVTFDNEFADMSTNLENAEPADSDEHAANGQLFEEMQAETDTAEVQPDLPELPTDISTLDILSIDQASPGCVIAFKQMEMSEHTQWCPVISEYKTAKIEAVLENDVLKVVLAARDVLRKEKKYDPLTGDRIYSKFEMEMDDDEESDERHLEIGLQDMIDPKLVKAADVSCSTDDVSETTVAVFDGSRDILTTSKEVTAAVELIELAQDDVDEEADLNPQNIKIEPAADSPSRKGIFNPAPKRIYSLLVAEDSQSPNCAETVSPQWRVGSVELGSQNPPQRFFSEVQSAIPSNTIEETVLSPMKADRDDAIPSTEIELDVSTTVRCDDPSIWVSNRENDKEESTRYYSLSGVETVKRSSPSLYHEIEKTTDTPDKENDVGASEEALKITTPPQEIIPALQLDTLPSKQVEDSPFEDSLFVDNVFEDTQPEPLKEPSVSVASVGAASEEPTFLNAESPRKGKSPAKNDSGAMSDDWNSDTDSSSLPSLKDILSQSVARTSALPQIKSKDTKKNKYSKLSAAREEDVESFVFSQAPKRLISDTHKMLVDDEVDSFVGSSYADPPVETYELEAHVTDTGSNELEENEPELPPFSVPGRLSETPRATKKNRFASPLFTKPIFHKPKATKLSKDSESDASKATVIDLTLSSDPVDPDEASSQPAWTISSSMPQGSGWIGKAGGSLKVKGKGNGKGSKRNLKRTKSLV